MTDDLDDILGDGRRAEVESRFRELEQQEELERMRSGGAPRGRASSGSMRSPAAGRDRDDLADLKSELDGAASPTDDRPSGADGPCGADTPEAVNTTDEADARDSADTAERYVLILCPDCGTKNRTSLTKVRTRLPRCGACKASLSFSKRQAT